MPEWAITILGVIATAILISLCGWLGDRLRLNNWHLAAIFAIGVLIAAVGATVVDVLAILLIGIVIFAFAAGVWSSRAFRSMTKK